MATPAMGSETAPRYVNSIAIDRIVESKTNPRKHFDKKALHELALSIAEKGIIVPLLVRPKFFPAAPVNESNFEIVAGARRFRAAVIAELGNVPVIVRDLSDDQVLEIQVIENLQRADVHPLEEANGYKKLLSSERYADVEALAAKVGKSTSYIYQRLKLADLIEPAQKAFFEDVMTAGHAIQIARLQPENQKKALHWVKSNEMSVRDLARQIDREFHLDLAKAAFPKEDAELVPKAGSCTNCPKRTGNAPQLFEDVKKGDTCTDPNCFHEKERTFVKIQVGTHPDAVMISTSSNYANPKPKGLTEWRKAGAKTCKNTVEAVVVEVDPNYHNNERAVTLGQVLKICKNPRCQVHPDPYRSSYSRPSSTKSSKADLKRREQEKIDTALEQLVLNQIVAVVRKRKAIGLEDLRILAGQQSQYSYNDKPALAFGLKDDDIDRKWIAKLSAGDCEAFLLACALTDYAGQHELMATARRYKVNITKLRAEAKTLQTSAPKKGTCRHCGCTERHACKLTPIPGSKATQPCSWIDSTKTVCSNPTCVAAAKKEKAAA